MRRFGILSAIVALGLVTGCNPEPINGGEDNPGGDITVTIPEIDAPGQIEEESASGVFDVDVPITDTDGWKVEVRCDGKVITSAYYEDENYYGLVYHVSENTSSEERTGWIEIKISRKGYDDIYAHIDVLQEPKPEDPPIVVPPVVKGDKYIKVTEPLVDWTGTYLIVYEGTKVAFDGRLLSFDKNGNYLKVTITDGYVEADETTDAASFSIGSYGNGWYMKSASGKYFGTSSTSNSLETYDTPVANTISSDGTIKSSAGTTLRFNTSYGFRFYKTGQQGVVLYRLNGSADGDTPTPPVISEEPEVITSGTVLNKGIDRATLQGSYKGFQGVPAKVYFAYGTSRTALNGTASASASTAGSGSFTATVTGLSENTEYYYQAYAEYEDEIHRGEVCSFRTKSSSTSAGESVRGWFEMPALKDANEDGVVDGNDDLYYAVHLCDGPETYMWNGKSVKARNYTVCFSASHHCPVWVAAPRHKMYSTKGCSRTDAYKQDPDIPSNIQAYSKETGGGCNKGHMLGSAERLCSANTNRQVFYYTNIAPQLSSGFNTGGGGWNLLEDYIDTIVPTDTLYEVVGCYFDRFTDNYGHTVAPKTISYGGRNDVGFPTMFYYAVLRKKKVSSKPVDECSASELQCVAFVRAHTNSLKGQKPSSTEMMSISALETITGFEYFVNVPNAPKDTFNPSDWGL